MMAVRRVTTLVRRLVLGAGLGAAAGAAGTVAMDALWYARYRNGGGTRGPIDWEFGGVDGWDDVSAPGQVGEKVLTALRRTPPPDGVAQVAQNVVHWSTGVGWGSGFGVVAALCGRRRWWGGLVLGVAAWLSSYVMLPLMKVYKPIWKYSAKTLAKDLTAHLLYGTTTGAVLCALMRPRDGH